MYSVRLLSFPLRLDEALKKRDILRDPVLQEALICGVIATATDAHTPTLLYVCPHTAGGCSSCICMMHRLPQEDTGVVLA